MLVERLKNQNKQLELKGTATRKLKKVWTQLVHLVNSIQKSRFPSTYVHLHLENQSQILTQSRDVVRILLPDSLKTC